MRRSTGDQRGGGDPQKDDGVLVNNRLRKTLPVVDEVTLLEQVPEGVMAAVEVAAPGGGADPVEPYGIATFFGLSPEETEPSSPSPAP